MFLKEHNYGFEKDCSFRDVCRKVVGRGRCINALLLDACTYSSWRMLCRNNHTKNGLSKCIVLRRPLAQLRVLRFGFFQDRDVRVGVFPEGEEVLIGGFRFGGVACHRVSATDIEMG